MPRPTRNAPAPSFWDDEDVQRAAQGGYVRLEQPGDSFAGTIAKLAKRRFDEGTDKERLAVEVTFDDEQVLTAGQVILARLLFEARPAPGDKLHIELTEIEKRGAKTLKHWAVTVTRPDGAEVNVEG